MADQIHLIWRGDDIYERVEKAVTSGLTEWALTTESSAKAALHPGRGVVTGTYRRSIHAAGLAYNFEADNVRPSASSPERSGRGGNASRNGDTISIVIGSGMIYAGFLERLYRVIEGAFINTQDALPGILRKHALREGLKPD